MEGKAEDRKLPNILVTGTPGTGKSSLCSELEERCGLKHIAIGDIVRKESFHGGRDKEFDSFILDEEAEDRLCDYLEPIMAKGGCIVEFHSIEFFPERWFDLVLCLRCDNTILYDRLKNRGYPPVKITENIEAEIMRTCLEEAQESYAKEIVHEVVNEKEEDLEKAVLRTAQWLEQWKKDHQ